MPNEDSNRKSKPYDREKAKEQLLKRTQESIESRKVLDPFKMIKDVFIQVRDQAEMLAMTDDKESLFYARAKATSRYYNALNDMKKLIETKYGKELWGRDYYPRKWMLDDKRIYEVIQRTKLIRVLNFLNKQNLDPRDPHTLELAKGKKFKTIAKSGRRESLVVHFEYSLILVNKDFYERAEKKLNIKQIYVQKHLQALCKIGILVKLMRTGEGGKEWLYADGYYTDWDGKKTKKRFLKNTQEMREGLRNFRVT